MDEGIHSRGNGPPTVTGLSPTEGVPGTQITIRGENLGCDQNDVVMLFICGVDCLPTMKMENFSPQWYLLEITRTRQLKSFELRSKNMELSKQNDAKRSEEMHKANLYSLINCVDTLANLHQALEKGQNADHFAALGNISKLIKDSKTKAESVFADVLKRKDDADATRNALGVIVRFKFIFFLSSKIEECMKKGEYITILNDYTRAKSLYQDTEVPLFRELMVEIDKKMDVCKEEMKRKLIDTPVSYEEQSKLIKYLKILDPDSDPTWDCITSYYVWLEKSLWDMQTQFLAKAKSEDVENQQRLQQHPLLTKTNELQNFVTTLVELLLSKLPSFWKLANTYHSSTVSPDAIQRLEDINQMLTNIINVSSWLILNALVPKALPDMVMRQYEDKFAKWPLVMAETSRNNLQQSLKTTRSLVASLLENQFSPTHVQPLVELCMTVRLKLVSDFVDCGVERVALLAQRINWKQDILERAQHAKTILPDYYENEICECLTRTRDALSTSGYPGEACLFSRERFRDTIIDLFVHLITSIKICFDRLFTRQRPQKLEEPEKKKKSNEITTKKLLIAVGDIEFIIAKTLNNVGKKMHECGVKHVDQIQEKSRAKLSAFRTKMINDCIAMMSSAFQPLIASATYEYMPDDDDISDYAKEMILCSVLQQSELELYAPQLAVECLQQTVSNALDSLLMHFSKLNSDTSPLIVTQIVIDLTGLEEALSTYAALAIRVQINTYRAGLVGRFDKERLQKCLKNMRTTMRMALQSLEQHAESQDDDTHNTSNI
uniref:Exocyst complex component 2 n=1 Tax=Caenorhabditis japonica TaxID=281687 RepID=A0A8R1DWW7_CAEJA